MEMKPIEGAERGGAVGFFKGVGKGLVGFVIILRCPAYGCDLTIRFQAVPSRNPWSVFLILHRTSAKVCSYRAYRYYTPRPAIGIRNTTTVFDEPARERVRLASGYSPSDYGDSHTPNSLVILQPMGC